MLDGGWWPRTTDPATEMPAIVSALGGARGTVTHILLNPDDWDLPHPRRLTAGGRPVRMGWFTSQPAGLITLICDFNQDRFDLLVIPPASKTGPAAAAMTAAADIGNTRHVPALLADVRR
jgi:hypothetical protein